jgi:hypothetical protein
MIFRDNRDYFSKQNQPVPAWQRENYFLKAV